MPSPRRRFTVADAMVLVAATAAGMAVARWFHALLVTEFTRRPLLAQFAWRYLPPCITHCLTIALLILRLRPPRPPLVRLLMSPGALVCLCVPLMLMGLVLISLPWFAGPHPVNRPWGIPLALVQARDYGAVVFVIFALLGGKQRRLREGDWVEWAGRLLGAWWLLLAIATEWVIWWW